MEAITAARKDVAAVSWAGVLAKRKRSNQILIILTRRKNDNLGFLEQTHEELLEVMCKWADLIVLNPTTQALLPPPFHSREHKHYACFGICTTVLLRGKQAVLE